MLMNSSRWTHFILMLALSLAGTGLIAQPRAASSGATTSSAKIFKAGAATSNVTPPLGVPLVGSTSVVNAAHVHDELHARCLALDDGTTRLVFVVVDNLSVNREVFDEAKRAIHAATGVPPENMMMSATHTHSGPNARGVNPLLHTPTLDEYQAFLARRIADGVRRAINQLEPARIAWGAGQLPQHVFNRRWLLKDGKTATNPFGDQDRAVMNPGRRPDLLQPAGPTNPEVYVLSLQSLAGRPIALLTNYWLHYVGGVPGDHVSADYFGAFCERLKELVGAEGQHPPFVGLLANGPCADVNNTNLLAPPGKRDPAYQQIQVVADDLAREVLRIQKTLNHRDWIGLKAAQAELELEVRHPTAAQVERARQALARPATVSPIHARELTYARRVIDAQEWPKTVSVILQAFRLGELGVASIPFEAFTETGLEIKAKSPFKDTFTIELANGGYAYLPTPEQHELGGYETWLGTNRVEKNATRKIVAQLTALLAQVHPHSGDAPTAIVFKPIFNGRDLTGWTVPDPNPFWSVQDGAIVGVHDEKLLGSTLWSEQKYGDFVFEFEVRWSGDMDSGIMFREPRSQLQMQIGVSRALKRDMTASFWISKGGYPDEGQAKTAGEVLKPEGQWNTLRLEARGTTYTASLNGRKVSQFTHEKFSSPGSLGLHVHANMKMKVEFRNLRVAELK
jgi:neutral ceramidase